MIWSPSADHLKNDLKPDLVTNVVLPKQDLVTNASLPKPDLVTNASRPKPDLITNAVLLKLDLVTDLKMVYYCKKGFITTIALLLQRFNYIDFLSPPRSFSIKAAGPPLPPLHFLVDLISSAPLF